MTKTCKWIWIILVVVRENSSSEQIPIDIWHSDEEITFSQKVSAWFDDLLIK